MQVVVKFRKVVELHPHRTRLFVNQATDVVFKQTLLQFLYPPHGRASQEPQERDETHKGHR